MGTTTVNLIGAGRVGQTLARLLPATQSYVLQDVSSRRHKAATDAAAFGRNARVVEHLVDMRPANIWILAVPDTKIAEVARALSDSHTESALQGSRPVALHCSGFYPAAQMNALKEYGWGLASAHPVLSFSDPETAASQFSGVPCGIEGDPYAAGIATSLFEAMGAECFSIRSDAKSLYHAAAVISNNFTVVLQALAREAWAEAGVSEDMAARLNDKLLIGTCENITAQGPQVALTGPAARGDTDVVAQQNRVVAGWHPTAGELYAQLSDLARSLKSSGKTR
ncbi:DUF2520 domain-containing protein [Ruegeria sp. R8_2]|nr:DUF2520 domain-containing protein [Ruegeria sp. R8_1]MBO9417632.1 DUF2520 domain-containing protein [Ruegeria sp. R8_2]